MLRNELSKTHSTSHSARSQADHFAIRLGLLTALIIVIYNLLIQALGDGGLEPAHLTIFLLLFFMIGYGMHRSRHWIRPAHHMDDRMLFGLVLSLSTAIGVIAMNGLLALLNYHLIISETFLPISDGWKFAVNSMALFWSCLIFGFLSAFIFAHFYERN